jgi:polyphosphate glucokinase
MKTLSIDIGGSKVKLLVLDEQGKQVTERSRLETPRPAVPEAILKVIAELVKSQGEYDRVSVGFPGVVRNGVVFTAPNLDPKWEKFDLAKALTKLLGKPARVANDADVQGYGIVSGKGVEMVITLGTGVGSSLFLNGKAIHLELGHHPFRDDETYEEQLGNSALEDVGEKRWNKRVAKMVELLDQIFIYDTLYIGGGNAKKITIALPKNVALANNEAGLTGGIALWRD